MGRFFNYDGPLFGFLDKLANLFILNVLFLICSIPIFTIGASWTALYYMTMKIAAGEEGYVFKGFFKAFKDNFKQATVIWLIMMTLGIIFRIDFYVLNYTRAGAMMVIRVLIFALLIIWMFEISYVFAVLAKFDNTVKQTMKNALLMSIRHLPFTAALFAIWAIAGVLVYCFFYQMIPVVFILGFSCIAYCQSFIFNNIFANYIPKEDN
ncbi:MAG: DUF624 domain-containing protein [Lachnospiraceae bacterium]|nr:DUF624 domain-containing protein [Lachnospiraceae bacterium]